MNHLPIELISEVFLIVVGSYGTSLPLDFIPSVRLSHVCRLWRDIAHLHPCLWTTLRLKGTGLPLGEFGEDDVNEYIIADDDPLELTAGLLQRDCEALALFLEHSGKLPLTLIVEQGYPYGPSIGSSDYGRAFRETLVPNLCAFIRRCECLYLGITLDSMPWMGVTPELSYALNEATDLWKLTIGERWLDELNLKPCVFNRLRSLQSPDSNVMLALQSRPASHLQKLDVREEVAWVDVTITLQSCPNLRQLSLSMVVQDDWDRSPDALLTAYLVQLRSLVLGFENAGRPDKTPLRLFDFIETGSLTSLQVEFGTMQTEHDAKYLTNFLKRTPTLQSMALRNLTCCEEGFTKVLKSVPQLKSLYFFNRSHLRDGLHPILSLLSTNAGCAIEWSHLHSMYCPSLETFAFESVPTARGTSTTMRSIVTFLLSRVGIKDSGSARPSNDVSKCPRLGNSDHEQKPLRNASFSIGIPMEIALSFGWDVERFMHEGVKITIV